MGTPDYTNATVFSKLEGNFKERYAKNLVNLVPDYVKMLKIAKFAQGEKIGNKYHLPLIVSEEGGFTHKIFNGGAFELANPISLEMQDATVESYQTVLRSALDYESAVRSADSNAAFDSSFGLLMKAMKLAHSRREEIITMYGQSGLGIVESNTPDGANQKIVFTAASWLPQAFIGTKNHLYDFYNSTVERAGDAKIISVDVENRAIVVLGTADDTIAAGDVCYFANNYTGTAYAEAIGLDKIVTTSGTIFGVDNTLYDLCQGNTLAVGGGNLTLEAVLDGSAKLVNKGLMEKLYCMVSPVTFAKMIADQAAMRKFDASYSKTKLDNGSQNVTFYGQSGEIEIITGCVKQGEAFMFPDTLKRIGSTDITFSIPGMGGKGDSAVFMPMNNAAGVEFRSYSSFQLFPEKISHLLKFTGIVNS